MVVAVIGLLFVINWLSVSYISNIVLDIMGGGIVAKIIEAVFRTGIIVVIGLGIIYITKISKEINEIIDKIVGTNRVRH